MHRMPASPYVHIALCFTMRSNLQRSPVLCGDKLCCPHLLCSSQLLCSHVLCTGSSVHPPILCTFTHELPDPSPCFLCPYILCTQLQPLLRTTTPGPSLPSPTTTTCTDVLPTTSSTSPCLCATPTTTDDAVLHSFSTCAGRWLSTCDHALLCPTGNVRRPWAVPLRSRPTSLPHLCPAWPICWTHGWTDALCPPKFRPNICGPTSNAFCPSALLLVEVVFVLAWEDAWNPLASTQYLSQAHSPLTIVLHCYVLETSKKKPRITENPNREIIG